MLARRTGILPLFLVALLLLSVVYFWQHHPLQSVHFLPSRRLQLWEGLKPLLERYEPSCPVPMLDGGPGVVRFDAVEETSRINYISNVDQIEQPMQTAHDGFVDAIRDLRIDRAYVPGSMGIVSSAGGIYLPTFVVTLRLLRRSGTTLPIELFLKDETEYEPYFCEEYLPSLNAKCLVLSDIMSTGNKTSTAKPIKGFQLKAFSMLFSSFEKTLWLDADCVPLHDTRPLLNSAPFTSTGLVTWPDFFANTAAPAYFNISRQSDPPSTKRQATEAGMMLVNKKTHFPTLLLSAYYNYYGPDYYYTLLDQGAPGTGDKDTFLHAATALSQSVYAVSERPVDLGNLTPWDENTAINAGWIQADPVQDYALTSTEKYRVTDLTVAKAPRAFFIHAGAPEFNPGYQLLGEKLRGFDGERTRLWTYPAEAMKRLGFDAEKVFWEETMKVTCEMEGKFKTWRGKKRLCDKVRQHWDAVFGDQNRQVPLFTDD
ncbi:mannosyltransferase putative-domain-containing protein [Aspergillus stella-maris]|uniref:mannosyltransferase putative-domain-containing protein n=1 Tax=Aspergillus stella-maris TaxID=1810926 RepID=UPI003CCCFD1B